MHYYRRFLVSFLVATLGWTAAVQADAVTKCRALHHVDVDPGTGYANNQCLLKCVVHGKTSTHEMNEGFPCPLASSGTCHHGKCVQSTPKPKLGHVDIEIISASLSVNSHAYTTVCIQNSTVPVTNRAICVTCSSNVLMSPTKTPTWKSVCAGSGKYLFISDSRVSFEVWDHVGSHNNVFLGGASLTIPQLLSHNDNHNELHLALTAGKASGKLNVRVTWTPN